MKDQRIKTHFVNGNWSVSEYGTWVGGVYETQAAAIMAVDADIVELGKLAERKQVITEAEIIALRLAEDGEACATSGGAGMTRDEQRDAESVSHDVVQLAEMILSDCGCSTDNEALLMRVAGRISRAFWAQWEEDQESKVLE